MTYALDSNIISYLLKDNAVVYTQLDKALDDGAKCIIPPIAYYEIKRGLLFSGATKKAAYFEELCYDFGIGRMNTRIWDEAAKIYTEHRKIGQMIEDADIFIAAFCIVNEYTLVTHNTKHFININGLHLVDWTSAL